MSNSKILVNYGILIQLNRIIAILHGFGCLALFYRSYTYINSLHSHKSPVSQILSFPFTKSQRHAVN